MPTGIPRCETAIPCANCEHIVLVAVMNPWACGYFGDPVKACTCSAGTVTKYQKCISGRAYHRVLKLARTIADLAEGG